MYYVIFEDSDCVRLIRSDMPDIVRGYAKFHHCEIVLETDNILHTDTEIEELDDDTVKFIRRYLEVSEHNKPILERLEQLKRELPQTVYIIPPVFYIGFLEKNIDAEKKAIDEFKNKFNNYIKSGYKQLGVSQKGYILAPPDYETVLESQREERERLNNELWSMNESE